MEKYTAVVYECQMYDFLSGLLTYAVYNSTMMLIVNEHEYGCLPLLLNQYMYSWKTQA